MFVDKARITIKAGNGGAGSVSFHREKYVSAGGPDGGDGGKGGDVIFQVDTGLSTLVDFKYKRKYKANDGDKGSSNRCTGKSADPFIIKVPLGTVVREFDTGRIIADMSSLEPVRIAVGGKGGWGNTHFATATRQVPKFAKPGMLGENFDCELELKLLADVGLVGFPNVGKSTLISVVSDATPKIANYHFTTLVPNLGVVRISQEESFVMADIPGLIEGASDGVGLGHDFLRHVDRCRLIVHLVDISGLEGRDPKEDFTIINRELKNFSEELSTRKQIVVISKSDLASDEQIADFKAYIEETGYDCFVISAATKSGTSKLMYHIYGEVVKLPPIKIYKAEVASEIVQDSKNKFEVELQDGVYVITAEWLVNILNNANMDDYESLQYFQRLLRSTGIIDRLEEMGISEGDTVRIFDFEFDYIR